MFKIFDAAGDPIFWAMYLDLILFGVYLVILKLILPNKWFDFVLGTIITLVCIGACVFLWGIVSITFHLSGWLSVLMLVIIVLFILANLVKVK